MSHSTIHHEINLVQVHIERLAYCIDRVEKADPYHQQERVNELHWEHEKLQERFQVLKESLCDIITSGGKA